MPINALEEWPFSARLTRCPAFWRRSLHRTDSGRSGLEAGAGLHAPNRTLPRAGINQVEQESGRSFRDSQGLLHLNFVALAAGAAEDRAIR